MSDQEIVRRVGQLALVRDGLIERWVKLDLDDGNASDLFDPRAPTYNPADEPPLPDWVQGFRDTQVQATSDILDAYARGVKVVWLDAPVGSGKSLVGEMVRRRLDCAGFYTCSTKTLQEQYASDFPYAAVLKGRSNYPTQLADYPDVTCGDCTKGKDNSCQWCSVVWKCEYQVAKTRARESRLAVINTAYLLAEMNGGTSMFRGRELGVLDECDLLERELMSYVAFGVGFRTLQRLKLTEPKKGSHWPTIMAWIEEELKPKVDAEVRKLNGTVSLFGDVKQVRARRQMENLARDVNMVLRVARDVNKDEGDNKDADAWVRDNNAGPLVLKPVTVRAFGQGYLWGHAQKWLCMSGTIVSPEQLSRDLGLRDDEWAVVRVPMTFDVEARRVWQVPVADMVQKKKDEEWPKMREGVRKVVGRHEGERVLVHAVSYDLAKYLVEWLKEKTTRPVFSYTTAGQRDKAVADYLAADGGAVLVAPSLDRGVDFKGDKCRVVVIAKIPYPYLGDVQVSRRQRLRDGNVWYGVAAVRTLVQMCGRGVRSEDDWATTYVLDKQMGKLMTRSRRALPLWFRESVAFMREQEL